MAIFVYLLAGYGEECDRFSADFCISAVNEQTASGSDVTT